MRYDKYRYLWPPRPEKATAPASLRHYEATGWWAQAKMNGTCVTLYVPPVGETVAMGRHGPDHRLTWQPSERWEAFRRRLPPGQWFVFVGELLHDGVGTRGVGVSDTVYLFDLLVNRSEYLIGTSYRDRWQQLSRLCGPLAASHSIQHTHSVVMPGVWLTANHSHDFPAWFDVIRQLPAKAPVEGIVLKKPNQGLLPCSSETSNGRWQHKCRRSTDQLSF